jgi:hypothetical protein
VFSEELHFSKIFPRVVLSRSGLDMVRKRLAGPFAQLSNSKEAIMKVDNRHRLVNDTGQLVPFARTPNQGGPLAGGQPEYLIIHYTAGATADGAISWFKNPAA